MQLISKEKMLARKDWRDFEKYPKQDSSIVVHCYGKVTYENRMRHKFVQVLSFNAKTFDKSKLTAGVSSVYWKYGWLYKEELYERGKD